MLHDLVDKDGLLVERAVEGADHSSFLESNDVLGLVINDEADVD